MSSDKQLKRTELLLDGETLTIEQLSAAARNLKSKVSFSQSARERMQLSRDWVDTVQQKGEPIVYGINTGFGSKATVSINKERLRELQRNLIVSHSAGAGDPLPIDVVRAAMILRANTFAKGFSGIRLKVADRLLEMLEKGVTPWIPAQGSLGASGDLAPLSHMALVLSRGIDTDPTDFSGKAYHYNNKSKEWQLTSGKSAMAAAGIPRTILEAKEGLALNNGTQISTALLALAISDAKRLIKLADIAMAMTLEGLEGISAAFLPEIHNLRAHPGQIDSAANIRNLIAGSQLLDRRPMKVQDAYSLRCHPQVMAGIRDTLAHIENVLVREMNSTNDNPIIIPEFDAVNKAISGGNFHAQPVAFAADFLSIVLCEIGNISERRIFRMSDKNLNGGLPSFLISDPGLESGLMIAQYTAASLVSENKALVHPASVDSIPSCENQEDHVSMAPIAARKARSILENVEKILAIEFLYAAQALDFRYNMAQQIDDISPADFFGKGSYAAYSAIRQQIPFLDKDRPVYKDMARMRAILVDEEFLAGVENAVGKLR